MPRRISGTIGVLLGAVLLGACQVASSERLGTRPAPTPTTAPLDGAGATGGTVTLAFGGDVHFEGGLSGLPGRGTSTLGPISQALRSADLAVVNLETALTRRTAPARKELEDAADRYWFSTPPAALDVLDRSGVDVVSVANNHGADRGVAGLRDTLRTAQDAPVAVIGAGLDEQAAFTPHRTTVEGTDIAVLAADASPRESADDTWAVGPGTGPGLASARPGDTDRLVAAVRAAARVDDLVVVYLHWGEEGSSCSTGAQESLARELSEAGADIVVGAHAHVPLGAGTLGSSSTYVSYGLGNLFWYHGIQSETGVLQLTVRGGEVVDDTWVPAMIRPQGANPQPLTGAAGEAAVRDWQALRACTDLEPGPGELAATAADDLPPYASSVEPISASLAARMRSHDEARCPVPLADLRRVAVTHVGFDGRARDGALVVVADVADDVVAIFGSLYEARFPIRRMRLVDVYGGDDDRSMAADNTSAYNCRRVAGSRTWSDHAYGRAIDINPVRNPYVVGSDVRPPAARRFLVADRDAGAPVAPGVIREGDVVSRAFERFGWTWGGTYAEPDYQHFSLS